jgi:hypothetical protein
MLMRAVLNHSAELKRWLGLFLVVFILYGTTVEAAHRHGRIRSTESGATSLVEPEQTTTPGTSKSGCSDCLICQLHQSFNTTLTVFRLGDPPNQQPLPITAGVLPNVLSQTTGPPAGRAPPFSS